MRLQLVGLFLGGCRLHYGRFSFLGGPKGADSWSSCNNFFRFSARLCPTNVRRPSWVLKPVAATLPRSSLLIRANSLPIFVLSTASFDTSVNFCALATHFVGVSLITVAHISLLCLVATGSSVHCRCGTKKLVARSTCLVRPYEEVTTARLRRYSRPQGDKGLSKLIINTTIGNCNVIPEALACRTQFTATQVAWISYSRFPETRH